MADTFKSPIHHRPSWSAGRHASSLAWTPTPRPVVDWQAVPAMILEFLVTTASRFLSGASVRWIDCQPDTCQRIYFANHTSHLDMILIWSALPPDVRQRTRPVAAKDYWDRGPVRRYLAKTYNALLVDRKEIKVHQSPVDLMVREIGSTHSLIIFP